ncbi:MAG: hypothetical protein JKY43_03280 [Phycisphaerales bacterium]|nr:hypothetical protein [Phycisphaerales bacterium]
MTITGNQLLSALGSGILPSEGPRAKDEHATLNFQEVLGRVQRGEPSELGIKIGKDIFETDVSAELRTQIAMAADQAAIKGVSRAVVDLGESIVRLDVRNRVLEAQLTPSEGEVIDRIDGFVSMRQPSQASGEGLGEGAGKGPGDMSGDMSGAIQQHQMIPARVMRNTSLIDVLSAHNQ